MATADTQLDAYLIYMTRIHLSSLYAVCCWDWLISLRKEREFIWGSRWTPVKIIYLFTRYWVLATMPYVLWCYCVDHNEDVCQTIYKSPVALAMWNQIGCAALLLMRTYALYGANKVVVVVLVVLLFVVSGYQLWVAVGKMLPLPFVDGVNGPCLPMALPGEAHLFGFFVAHLIFDAIITAMTLIKTITLRRKNGPSCHLVQVFLREGLIYFLLISCANLINGIFYIQHRTEMAALMIPLSIMLSPLLACRMVIDLRMRAHEGSINVFGDALPMPRSRRASGLARWDGNDFLTPVIPIRHPRGIAGPAIELGDLTAESDYKIESPVSAHTSHSVRLPLVPIAMNDSFLDVRKCIAVT